MIVKILARGFSFYIQTAPDGTEYTKIGGITSFSFSSSKNDVDTTDYDSGGFAESQVSSRTYGLSLEGIRKEDIANGDRDPGQQAVEDLSDAIGLSGETNFLLLSPSGRAKRFAATASGPSTGGGNDDPASWNIELTIIGKVESLGTLNGITLLPSSDPTTAVLKAYSPSSYWNMTLAERGQTTVHPNSTAMIAAMEQDGDGSATPNVWTSATDQFTLPVYDILPLTEVVNQNVIVNGSWRFGTDDTIGGSGLVYPYTVSIPLPSGVTIKPAAGSDSQIVIADWVNGSVYNFWSCGVDASGNWDFTCTNASRYDQLLDGMATPGANRLYSAANTKWNTRGAKIDYLAGLVRKAELEEAIAAGGSLSHALAYAIDYALRNDQQAAAPSGLAVDLNVSPSVYPAMGSDGGKSATTVSPNDPPEGACIRVKPTITEQDMTALGLTAAAKVLIRTLQQRGAFCIDQSGRTKFYLEYDGTAQWGGLVSSDMLSAVPWSWFEVMDYPLPTANAGPDQAVVQGEIVSLSATPQLINEPSGYPRSILEHRWVVPAGVSLSSTSIPNPSWSTAGVTPAVYTLAYHARDNRGWWQADNLAVTVNAGTPAQPIASISETLLWGGTSTITGTPDSYSSSSWAPGANELLAVVIASKRSTIKNVLSVSGNGATWTKHGSTIRDSQNQILLEVWTAKAASYTPGAVTVSIDGETGNATAIQALRLTPNPSITAALTATTEGAVDTNAPSHTMSVAAQRFILGICANRSGNFTPATGWTANKLNTDTNGSFGTGGSRIALSTFTQAVGAAMSLSVSGSLSGSSEWIIGGIEIAGG